MAPSLATHVFIPTLSLPHYCPRILCTHSRTHSRKLTGRRGFSVVPFFPFVLSMSFTTLYEWWAQAHAELMNATGWDALAAQFMAVTRRSPDLLASVREDVTMFFNVIPWHEPFFRCLGAAHVALLLAVAALTRGNVSDTRLELCGCGLLILAQCTFLLNPLGRRYVPVLFEEPRKMYFDEEGFFITIFFWAPIMCMAVCVLVRCFVRFMSLLVKVARKRVAVAAKENAARAGGTTQPDQGPSPVSATPRKKRQ